MSATLLPSVFHGGDDDLSNALAHLSWKEMAIMTAILFSILGLIVLTVILAE